MPTVCGLCPVGCNISATTREGKVKRILSRNHPEVDEGWLCDKGRFAFAHLDAADRITAPLRKAGPRRFEQLSWEDALDAVESALRAGGESTLTALSGGETVEEAYALAKLLRRGLGANLAVLPEPIPDGLDSYRAPLSALRDAKTIAVISDTPVVERAPVVELWLKAARRAGATIQYGVPDGPVDALVTDHAETAETVRAESVYFLPLTPNGRGVTDAWSAAGDGEPIDAKPRLVVLSGDEAALDPNVRVLAAEADVVIGIGMFQNSFRGVADLVLPGTSYLERDGTTVNLEGRLQRQRRAVLAPVPDVLAWLSKLGERFGVEISPYSSVVFDEIGGRCFGGISYGDVGEQSSLPPRAARPATPESDSLRESDSSLAGPQLRLARYKPLFSGPAVERTPELQFQRAERRAPDLTRRRARAEDPQRPDRHGLVERHVGRAARAHRARPGGRDRSHRRGRRGRPARPRRGGAVSEAWWITIPKAFLVVNVVMVFFAFTTWLERKLLGRMQQRFGPNRAGPKGLLVPIADLLKLIRKEAFAPSAAKEPLYILAPVVSMATALLAFSVLPFGAGWDVWGQHITGSVVNVPISLILIFALGSLGIYGFIVGGWASESKYSLLGSMRTCAQLVSYEVSLALSVLGVVLMGQSLNLQAIVDKQETTLWFFIPQAVGLVVFLFGAIAETSRPPFDLPEADTELVAGYHTEYSGMRWGLFQAAEYVNMLVLSGLVVTLFFGGYHFPWVDSLDKFGPIWFVLKLFFFVTLFIWLRATQPRLRYDQLMRFGWKVLLPVATVNALVTAFFVVLIK